MTHFFQERSLRSEGVQLLIAAAVLLTISYVAKWEAPVVGLLLLGMFAGFVLRATWRHFNPAKPEPRFNRQ